MSDCGVFGDALKTLTRWHLDETVLCFVGAVLVSFGLYHGQNVDANHGLWLWLCIVLVVIAKSATWVSRLAILLLWGSKGRRSAPLASCP